MYASLNLVAEWVTLTYRQFKHILVAKMKFAMNSKMKYQYSTRSKSHFRWI